MVDQMRKFEIANTFSEEEEDRVNSFVDMTVNNAMESIKNNTNKEMIQDALSDMLAHELAYMASWDSSEDLARKFIKSLSEEEIDRLTSMITYKIANEGILSIDYRSLKRPFILDTITNIIEESKKLKNEKYCPNCGKKTDANKSQCIYCHTYLSIENKRSVKIIKKILNKINKKEN